MFRQVSLAQGDASPDQNIQDPYSFGAMDLDENAMASMNEERKNFGKNLESIIEMQNKLIGNLRGYLMEAHESFS